MEKIVEYFGSAFFGDDSTSSAEAFCIQHAVGRRYL